MKAMAESLASGVEVEAVSVDAPNAAITEHVDLLFIGGALYAFKLDPTLVDFIESIPEGMVRQAIVFGSSALTRRPVYLIQALLKQKNIDINPMALYQRGRPKPYLLEIAPPFARDQRDKLKKQLEEGTYGEAPEAPIVQMLREREEKKNAEQASQEQAE